MDGHVSQAVARLDRARWLVLAATCLGALMVILDATIVNVALPVIGADLGIAPTSLVWLVNGYMIPYGGFLLLCGRLADYSGHRRAFASAIVLFTLASLGCGLSPSALVLVGGRVIQGIAAAAVQAVSLSLIMEEFQDKKERARALAIYSSVLACGSSTGVLAGGVLTSVLGWRWIFLVNLPIGAVVYGLCRALRFHVRQEGSSASLDGSGAVTATIALTMAITGVFNAARMQWSSVYVAGPLCGCVLSFALFLVIESRAPAPLIPLALFKHRALRVGVVSNALGAAVQATWFFVSALNLAALLGHEEWRVGLAYLPATLLAAIFPLCLISTLIAWVGTRWLVVAGLLFEAAALLLFARAPLEVSYVIDLLPGMLLLGLGAGLVYAPLALSTLACIAKGERGVASGILNNAGVMGAALGIAIVTSAAATRSRHLVGFGVDAALAQHSGYNLGYLLGAAAAIVAALISLSIDDTRIPAG